MVVCQREHLAVIVKENSCNDIVCNDLRGLILQPATSGLLHNINIFIPALWDEICHETVSYTHKKNFLKRLLANKSPGADPFQLTSAVYRN